MNKRIFTFIGIIISYAGISTINWLFKAYSGLELNNSQVIMREALILGLVGFLFLLIVKGERLGLQSIGLYFDQWKKSLILTVLIFFATLGAIILGVIISQQLGWSFGESTAFDSLSLWTITLITIRAGVAEEVFMRGYLLERLRFLTNNQWIIGALSLIPFALFHYPGQGWAGVLVSFNAGFILTLFYFWKRDLKANILAHFLIDFIANVVPEWF